ncbi:MAG: hypothetical protein QXR73_03520, partial [Candidatus Micrarchaeaceae archaeon]
KSAYAELRRMDPDKDILYRLKDGPISEAECMKFAETRPYVANVLPRVINAVNALGDGKGFSIYDIFNASGAYMQGVGKVVRGLAELGLLEKEAPKYTVTPKEAAKTAWERFFKPLGDKAYIAAIDSDTEHGVENAAVTCAIDAAALGLEEDGMNWAISKRLDAYLGRRLKMNIASMEPKVIREHILKAFDGKEHMSRREILESMKMSGNPISEDRLSWYLLQLRRERKLTIDEAYHYRKAEDRAMP